MWCLAHVLRLFCPLCHDGAVAKGPPCFQRPVSQPPSMLGQPQGRLHCDVLLAACAHVQQTSQVLHGWSRGVTVSTLDSKSSDRGSNPRETSRCGVLPTFFLLFCPLCHDNAVAKGPPCFQRPVPPAALNVGAAPWTTALRRPPCCVRTCAANIAGVTWLVSWCNS